MSKILAVADIHINDYANRNPSNRFRLYQTRTVAQNIIEVGKREGCDTIVFAGDIVEKCIIRPYIQGEVKLFLDTVMAEFKEGYIIWGNHDLDGKSVDQDISDACLGVMLPKNLYYSHKQIINIDGKSIGFCNWMPTFDLSWIPGKVDVLFTHATICYAKDASEGRLFESQELDESKFDLAICGDIHKSGSIGKYVSIGCCQRCKLSDPEEATGIVLDTANKKWSWVNLNPHDNLMKFATTTNLDEEGWHDSEKTWYVYKQESSILGQDQGGNVKLNAWEEISGLVDDAIVKSGLSGVHQEVLNNISNIDSGEVDFNFTLMHLHCENWRSIKSVDVNFSDHDRILVIGSNGSGKSSLLSAIKFALCDVADTVGVTSLKPFVTFGEKDCLTEITFMYQGNECKIQRGTSKYGLWINGEQLKYNSKKLFEQDVRDRFPFIKYMDAFFFDADKTSFLRSLSPERVTDITSKFLKLNRIDTYNETAKVLYNQIKAQAGDWNMKLSETTRLLTYINEKLNSLVLPGLSKNEMIRLKEEGLEIQRKNAAWNQYYSDSARLQALLQSYTERLHGLEQQRAGFRNPGVIDSEIEQIQGEIKNIQASLVDLGNIRINFSYKMKEYENLRTEGNAAWAEAQSIGIGKTCTHCGQIIKTSEALEKHKQELLQKVEDIKPKIAKIQEELTNLNNLKENSSAEYDRLNADLGRLNNEVSNRMMEKSKMQSVENEYNQVKYSYNKTQADLQSLGYVERVDLPENFMSRMAELENGINTWTLFEDTEKDKYIKEQELQQYQQQVQGINDALGQLEAYIKLTGPTGLIFEEIFNRLAVSFSSNTVKYIVDRKGKGKQEHLSLVPHFNNNGNLVPMQLCSSGQRTLLDVDYMSKIFTNVGICVFDEFLRNLDSQRAEEVLEIMKNMNIGCFLLTSHMDSLPVFNNKTCLLSLGDDGMSNIIFK